MTATASVQETNTQTTLEVVDADAHVVETEHTWDYMDPAEAKYRPKLIGAKDDETHQYWLIDGKIRGVRFPRLSQEEEREFSRQANRDITTPLEARELINVDIRLQHMDRIGVDVQVLHNTLFIEQLTTRPEVEVALCRSWNRWLADIWKQGHGRLRWSCVLPTLSMPDALDQLAFAQEHGACAIVMRPLESLDRLPYDPYFYPLYEEATRRDMAIALHLGNANPANVDMYRSPYDRGSGFTLFRVPTVACAHALACSQVPELFPKLRWGFIEVSAQWLPWIAHELARRLFNFSKKPEDVWGAYPFYVTCQTDDDLPYILKYSGEDSLVIGTDYGHYDTSAELDAILTFKEKTDITARAKEKILSTNPKRLYGLEQRGGG